MGSNVRPPTSPLSPLSSCPFFLPELDLVLDKATQGLDHVIFLNKQAPMDLNQHGGVAREDVMLDEDRDVRLAGSRTGRIQGLLGWLHCRLPRSA